MASTPRGTALTESHRVAQVQLKAISIADTNRLWTRFDIDDPFRSWNEIEPAVVRLIQTRRRASALLTGRYFDNFHTAEAAPGRAAVRLAQPVDADDLIPNLRLVGPVWAERSGNAAAAFSNVSSEITRRVLEGGRQTLVRSADATTSCLGYYRVSDGAPCAFCALLIGRGAVYSSESADFEAHRGCGCTGEPLYRRDQPPANAEVAAEFGDIYDSIPADVRGADRVREFQRRYRATQT